MRLRERRRSTPDEDLNREIIRYLAVIAILGPVAYVVVYLWRGVQVAALLDSKDLILGGMLAFLRGGARPLPPEEPPVEQSVETDRESEERRA